MNGSNGSHNVPNVPDTQWAQVVDKSGGPCVYKQIPVQKPGPDEVLVNIKYSGVCHTGEVDDDFLVDMR
jgi:Zn-dependent alcohol dehydrogenase